MSKPRLNAPKPPRRPGSSLTIVHLAIALVLGAGAGGYVAHVVTKNRAAEECREALQAQILSSLPTEPPAPVVQAASAPSDAASAPESAPASPPQQEAPASAAVAASTPAAAKAPEAPTPKPPVKAPAPSTKAVAPTPSAAAKPPAPKPPVLIPTAPTAAPVATSPTPEVSARPAPAPASAPAAAAPAPAPAKPVVDMTPRNPQVVARNGDVVFVRINEKTTLQVKKGTSLPGFGVLQGIEADGAHFDSGVVPLAK